MRTSALLLAFLVSLASGLSLNAKKRLIKSPPPVNVQAVVDSAILMADDYATAVTEKPELSRFRLNRIKDYYSRQSQRLQDSIRANLFNLMTNYVDTGNHARAKIFKDCYLTLAAPDDNRMGNIYAAEMALAFENDDTTEVKRIIPLLEEYAERKDYDFDEEIAAAKDYLDDMRRRGPIRYDLMGVWVSEKICEDIPFRENILKSLFSTDTPNNETHSEIFHRISNPYYLGITNDKIIVGDKYHEAGGPACFKDYPRFGYKIPEDIISEGKYTKKKSYFFDRLSPTSWFDRDSYYECFPQTMLYDEKLRSAYGVWSNEMISSFNPDYYAQIRQNQQYSTAEVLGNMARKNVRTSTKIKGRAALTAMDNVSNAILDRLTVSSATFWIREITVQLDSPNVLTAWIYTQYNRTKSNNGLTQTKDKDLEGVKYYKWEPDDDVFFREGNQYIILGNFDELSKAKKKAMKDYYKVQKEVYQSQYGKLGMSQKKYDEFHRWFNTQMFNKLKNKAEQIK